MWRSNRDNGKKKRMDGGNAKEGEGGGGEKDSTTIFCLTTLPSLSTPSFPHPPNHKKKHIVRGRGGGRGRKGRECRVRSIPNISIKDDLSG